MFFFSFELRIEVECGNGKYVLFEKNVVVVPICSIFVLLSFENLMLFDIVVINELFENVDGFFLFFDYFCSKV